MPERLETDRLVLRRWRAEDREPLAAISADPEVMAEFPSTQTRAQSDALVERAEASFERGGYGLWAVEERASGRLAGFVGLADLPPSLPAAPAVEVGWRLARWAWGRGYAVEAARAALRHGFEDVGLAEVVSVTATTNVRSQRVMQRLGMVRDPAEDFDHPLVPAGHRVERHVLYRLPAARWRELAALDPVAIATAPAVPAPDGSTVRLLPAVEHASTAVFVLDPGRTAAAVRHPRVEEVWIVLRGRGELWRRLPSGAERVDGLRPGAAYVLPRGTAFQFRNRGDDRLEVLGVTAPPWAGDADAEPAAGPW